MLYKNQMNFHFEALFIHIVGSTRYYYIGISDLCFNIHSFQATICLFEQYCLLYFIIQI